MSVKIRQEINIVDGTFSPLVGIVQLDTTQYVSPTYYFEVVTGSIFTSSTITLQRKTGGTNDASISATATSTRYRTSFTPPAGQTEYIITTTASDPNAARIIVIDNPTTLTSTQTQIEIGNYENASNTVLTPLVYTKYWLYTAANWDGTTTFYAEAVYKCSSSKSTVTVVLQEDNGSFASWTNKVTIVSAGSATVPTRVRSASFTPTDGRHYRLAYNTSSSKSAGTIAVAKVIVDQTASSGITLLEPQYLLLNTANTGTGLQNHPQLLDLTEWSGVTNVYKHAADSNNAANATKLEDTTTTTVLANTAVTGANQQISADFTSEIVTGDTLDTDIITATGVTAASRILVAVTVSSAVNASVAQSAATLTFTGGTQTVASTAFVALSQSAATLTFTGGTQVVQTNTSDAQVGTTLTFTGGTQSIATSNFVALAQSHATLTLTGGTQAVATSNFVALSQVGATLTFTGGTQSVATIRDVQVAQSGATLTFTGGTQAFTAANDISIAQVGASLTFTGGTQTVTVSGGAVSASITQVAATLTFTGGTQAYATINDVQIAQVRATLTLNGGTQTIATINDVQVAQVGAVLTFSGGTQVSKTNAIITQVGAVLTFNGGTQVIATVNDVQITQTHAILTFTGGTQSAGGLIDVSIAQSAATLTFTGGTQSVATSRDVAVTQSYAILTFGSGVYLPNPSIVFTAVAVAGTTMGIGIYKYQITYFNSLGQQTGGSSEVSVTTTSGNQNVLLTFPAFPAGVASIGTARTLVNGASGSELSEGAPDALPVVSINDNYPDSWLTFLNQPINTVNNTTGTLVTAVQDGQIAQVGATLTFAGGTQTITVFRSVSIAQVAATLTFAGGTQVAGVSVIVAQSAATLTFAGGTQALLAQIDANVAQVAASLIFSGGIQSVEVFYALLKSINLALTQPGPIDLSVITPAVTPITLKMPGALDVIMSIPTPIGLTMINPSSLGLDLNVPGPIDVPVIGTPAGISLVL